ncbi:hypothetical protein GCM10010269_53590 [Streptomyces humidus]|uniref:Uncharacterized protein n=1 Tax=Streptomyces humidus TaxID=52259 RepID=A0A918FZZ7_9ACTN|nr:hypothetical protein [Streptomyces humidus]GGS07835.1 hypothetical protein GCM10010269_53590 [Streptomyces humidus]
MSVEEETGATPSAEPDTAAEAQTDPVRSAPEPQTDEARADGARTDQARTDEARTDEAGSRGEPPPGPTPRANRAGGRENGGGGTGGGANENAGNSGDPLLGEETTDFGAHLRERRHGINAHRAAVSGAGMAMYVENLNSDGRQPVGVRVSPFTQDRVLELHEDVPHQAEMARSLKEHRVVVLWGRPGSGRRSTAAVLLAEQVPRYQIRVLHAEGGGDPLRGLCEQPGKLTEDNGYLLDAGDRPVTPELLDRLVQSATDRRVCLVVFGTRAATGTDPMRGQVFEHIHPPLRDVLRRHLVALLSDHGDHCPRAREGEPPRCDAAVVDRYVTQVLDHPEVQPLIKAPPVGQVVELARYLAGKVHSEDPDLLGIWRDRMRHLARRMLSSEGELEEGTPVNPHVQSFRMAYAMFHLHPLADAFAAGEVLSAEILPLFETRESTPPNHVFNRDLARLIPADMRSAEDQEADTPRRAHLVDVDLLHAFLEVAWHDYDSLRRPLLNWLTALLGRSDLDLERVRVRVAEIAGILLRHDFDGVYRQLIRPWANGRSAVYRQCAAVAMEAAFLDEELRDRAAGQAGAWANSPRRLLQDTAARTYGTQIGLADVPAALRRLTALGSRPELAASSSVAFSTSWLFLHGATAPVIAQVRAWLDAPSDHLPRHAMRTMITLGRFSSGPGRQGRPALAEQALVDEKLPDLLADLWTRTMLSSETSTRAWDLMRQWLVAADGHEDLAALFETLAVRIFSGPLNRRALWHLRVWRMRHTTSPTLRRIEHAVRSSGG